MEKINREELKAKLQQLRDLIQAEDVDGIVALAEENGIEYTKEQAEHLIAGAKEFGEAIDEDVLNGGPCDSLPYAECTTQNWS